MNSISLGVVLSTIFDGVLYFCIRVIKYQLRQRKSKKGEIKMKSISQNFASIHQRVTEALAKADLIKEDKICRKLLKRVAKLWHTASEEERTRIAMYICEMHIFMQSPNPSLNRLEEHEKEVNAYVKP